MAHRRRQQRNQAAVQCRPQVQAAEGGRARRWQHCGARVEHAMLASQGPGMALRPAAAGPPACCRRSGVHMFSIRWM